MNLYIYQETTSTNDLAQSEAFGHGDVIWALHQSAGRGQRGNRWSGGVGENIAFTIVVEPRELAAAEQFLISQIAALSLHDAMEHYGIGAKIKWTNDIYVGDRKMAGILIENSLRDGLVRRSIVGIGLNINQLVFDASLPNPTSMRCESGRRFPREEVLRYVAMRVMHYIATPDVEAIRQRYNELLYRLGESHTYRKASGESFRAVIEGVAPHGELLLRHSDSTLHSYLFREVEFVIAGRER